MKIIKAIFSVLTLIAANMVGATTWSITMNANTYSRTPQGDEFNIVLSGFEGIWDDVANAGTWHGIATFPEFDISIAYDQTFTMDETKGTGRLDIGFNCEPSPGCFSEFPGYLLNGTLRNTHGSGYSVDNYSYKNAFLFTPVDGATFQWTIQLYRSLGNDEETGDQIVEFVPIPMNVTLHAPTPEVPLPATAWMLGSGLIGLVATARKRKAH